MNTTPYYKDVNSSDNMIIQQSPLKEDESNMNMSQLLEDFEENERRVYGFNDLRRGE